MKAPYASFLTAALAASLAACTSGASIGPGPPPAAGHTASPAPGASATPAPGVTPTAVATGTNAAPTATPTPASTGGTQALAGQIPALTEPLGHAGRWITDGDGRVVIDHGINVAYKDPPYTPQAQGFTQAHAAMLAREGFSNVRVWIWWKAFEPSPGVWDDSSLAATAQFVGWLHQYGITTRLCFAQILYSEVFGGLGLPNWSTDTDGLPVYYGGTFAADGAELSYKAALENLYDNTAYPDAMGLSDHMGRAWAHAAAYFRNVPGISSYDIMNEPNAGLKYGDTTFESQQLAPFYVKMIAAIRSADTVHTIDYEPQLLAAFGTPTTISAGGDPNKSLTAHYYPATADASDDGLTTQAEVTFQSWLSTAQKNGDAFEVTEFGATDDLTQIGDVLDAADAELIGWNYWAWYSTEPVGNPATPNAEAINPQEGIVIDPSQPPDDSNLKVAKLRVLGRPYPFLIAGTPTAWSFNTTTSTLTFSYSTTPAGATLRNQTTALVVPPRLYPGGYTATVTGATVTSPANAEGLTVVPSAGATTVNVTVAPAAAASSARSRNARPVR